MHRSHLTEYHGPILALAVCQSAKSCEAGKQRTAPWRAGITSLSLGLYMGAMEAEQADVNVQRAAADAPQKPLLPIDLDTDRVTYTRVCSETTKRLHPHYGGT